MHVCVLVKAFTKQIQRAETVEALLISTHAPQYIERPNRQSEFLSGFGFDYLQSRLSFRDTRTQHSERLSKPQNTPRTWKHLDQNVSNMEPVPVVRKRAQSWNHAADDHYVVGHLGSPHEMICCQHTFTDPTLWQPRSPSAVACSAWFKV